MNRTTNHEGKVAWQKIVAAYACPDLPRSIWQIGELSLLCWE